MQIYHVMWVKCTIDISTGLEWGNKGRVLCLMETCIWICVGCIWVGLKDSIDFYKLKYECSIYIVSQSLVDSFEEI